MSAEIPQEDENLKNLVLKHMIHGPCGNDNPNAPCMENGECVKEYPKKFTEKTNLTEDGYPLYKRRNGTFTHLKHIRIDNRNVVPFNGYLLKRFNCHINTEICTSFKSVKYIFKYIYKGYDCANVQISNDEIEQFINTRHVGSPEAMWRLLEYKMHDKSHDIIRLPVHLPNEQNIIFEEGREAEAVERERHRETKLTAFFKLNQEDKSANEFTYTEICEKYVCNSKNKWIKRKNLENKAISRLYAVSPKDKERFFLRMLLLNVKGPKSFDCLKTVDGVKFETFEEAARKRNLLIDDSEWKNVMEEAVQTQTPDQIRKLFSYICIFYRPINSKELFKQFSEFMIDKNIEEKIQNEKMLFEIHNVFE